MVPLGAVLILLIIFGSITTLILGAVHLKNKNKERMTILEKGVDPSILREEFKPVRNTNLKLGILFICIAIGIIAGYAIADIFYVPEAVAYFSSIFMLGGLGLLIGFYIDKKTEAKK